MYNLLFILKWGNYEIWANCNCFKFRMADTIWFLNHVSNNHNSEYHKSSKQGVCKGGSSFFLLSALPCTAGTNPTAAVPAVLSSPTRLTLQSAPHPQYICYWLVLDMFKNTKFL